VSAGRVRPSRRHEPTILDVARAAGVSKSTVSNVMRGADGVAAATRERVLAAASAVGYRPNALARNLVRRVRGPEDRRQVLCHATEKARRVLVSLAGPMADAGRRSLGSLDASRTAELIRLLDAVRAAAASLLEPDTNREEDQKDKKKETRK
jgi:DNA-binding LacI/PurR family transcriptional regulator